MTTAVFDDDPYGEIKKPKKSMVPGPREVNDFHTKADTDTGQLSIHHTLGKGTNQASPGDHTHNGNNSRKLGQGDGLTVRNLGGVTDAQRIQSIIALLHNFIDFTEVS